MQPFCLKLLIFKRGGKIWVLKGSSVLRQGEATGGRVEKEHEARDLVRGHDPLHHYSYNWQLEKVHKFGEVGARSPSVAETSANDRALEVVFILNKDIHQ
ncbi:hypothetical protein KY289_036651 [Solanum tuberosum]|nr:hypothetical protein KY284_036477 [Solanum tuberosum]KAH0636736.1 hypothetical protein KY289_036651 [Solanum tuberosum]